MTMPHFALILEITPLNFITIDAFLLTLIDKQREESYLHSLGTNSNMKYPPEKSKGTSFSLLYNCQITDLQKTSTPCAFNGSYSFPFYVPCLAQEHLQDPLVHCVSWLPIQVDRFLSKYDLKRQMSKTLETFLLHGVIGFHCVLFFQGVPWFDHFLAGYLIKQICEKTPGYALDIVFCHLSLFPESLVCHISRFVGHYHIYL